MTYNQRTKIENRNRYIVGAMLCILLFVLSLEIQLIGLYLVFSRPTAGAALMIIGSLGIMAYEKTEKYNGAWEDEE